MSWQVCGICVGEDKCMEDFGGETEVQRLLENLVVDGSIMLKWVLRKYDGRAWTEFIWLSTGTSDMLLWSW